MKQLTQVVNNPHIKAFYTRHKGVKDLIVLTKPHHSNISYTPLETALFAALDMVIGRYQQDVVNGSFDEAMKLSNQAYSMVDAELDKRNKFNNPYQD